MKLLGALFRVFVHPSEHSPDTLPSDIKYIAYARAVRWTGWGFGETLLPVFLLSFSSSFAETGLLGSILEIVTLICLPVLGGLADNISARLLILTSILLYPLIGFGYFLAGITGLMVWIVAVRALNGLLWSMENIGTETYYRRRAPREHLGIAFGYIDAVSMFGWTAAAIAGIFLVRYFEIHELILLTVPFALVGFIIALRAPRDEPAHRGFPLSASLHAYRDTLRELQTWGRDLYLLGTLAFFVGALESAAYLFLPIYAYVQENNLVSAILVGVVTAIPYLFAYRLGSITDSFGARQAFLGSLAILGLSLFFAGVIDSLIVTMAAAFVVALMLELFNLTTKSYITRYSSSGAYGRRGGLMNFIATLGAIFGPLFLGVLFDVAGPSNTFIVLAMIAGVFAVPTFFLVRKR